MRIILSILYFTYVAIIMLLSPILFIPYGILLIFKAEKKSINYMNWLSSLYAGLFLKGTFAKLEVKGLENLEKHGDNALYVSNHEGAFDVMAVRYGIKPFPVFIAKAELFKIPLAHMFLKGMRVLPMDRSNLRKSMEVIKEGAEIIKNGRSMFIFPEGTRNSGQGLRSFKRGSLKIAEWADGVIIPLTVEGAGTIFTKKGVTFGKQLYLTVHEPIDLKTLTKDEIKVLDTKLWEVVNSGFQTPHAEVMPPKVKEGKK